MAEADHNVYGIKRIENEIQMCIINERRKWIFDVDFWHDSSGSFMRKGRPLMCGETQKLIYLVSF